MSSEETAAHPAEAAVKQYRDTLVQISRDWETTVRDLDQKYPNRGRAGWTYRQVPRNEEHIQAYNTEYAALQAVYDAAQEVYQQAQVDYDRAYSELLVKYPKRGRGGQEEVRVEANEEHARAWEAERTAAAEADRQRRADAKTQFTESGNKLAVWLVESGAIDQYPDHVNEVLSWGPMSYEELVEKGRGTGWCNEFTRYLNLAHRAGVIEDGRTAKEQLLGKLARAGRLSESTRALVEQALAEAVAEAQQTSADTAETTTGEDA